MYIIDRFEGDIAVVEADETMMNIPRAQLPSEAQEGDVLQKNGEVYVVDHAATEKRKEEINRLMKGIWG
ncbi:MAG: DUF3006 domain-containing protein [Clostridia bacterium]|nr:DUF3006 domain-containing protein [Clostridia bacterium]